MEAVTHNFPEEKSIGCDSLDKVQIGPNAADVAPTPKVEHQTSLVCMPWHLVESPSIQIGTLKAVLDNSGISAQTHSMHLEFMKFISKLRSDEGGISLREYEEVCSQYGNIGVGEWVFAVEPAVEFSLGEQQRNFALLREGGVSRDLALRLKTLKAHVPEFLKICADEIMATNQSSGVYRGLLPDLAVCCASL